MYIYVCLLKCCVDSFVINETSIFTLMLFRHTVVYKMTIYIICMNDTHFTYPNAMSLI